jgi:hypothetical protein
VSEVSAADLFERDSADGAYHIVALSGGHDSSALALLLKGAEPRVYNYVCTPTGDELPVMFAHWNRMGELLGKRLIPIMNGTLKSVIRKEGTLPNFRRRFCTRILKIEPFRALLGELAARAPVVSYVGLRADEPGRAGGAYSDIPGVTMRFPLREWDMGEDHVQAVLFGFDVKCPDRTDCARCYHQRIGEWWELWAYHPEIYADAEADEAQASGTFRTPGRDSWPTSLREMRLRFEAGDKPQKSLDRMAKERQVGQCRVCTL